MRRTTPVFAIEPGDNVRRLLDMPGGPPYVIGTAGEVATNAPVSPGAVVVAPAAYLGRLRALCAQVKVLAIGHPDHAIDCLRAGAFSFFSEPVFESSFRDVLQNAMSAEDWENDLQLDSATFEWVGLRVRCKMDTVDRLIQWLREIERDLHPKEREDLLSALRELISNGIEHGGHSDPGQILRVSRVKTRRTRTYHIQDPGPGFSFDDLPHAAVSNVAGAPIRHAEVRDTHGMRPGGFGIMLSRNLADELIYSEKGNEVLLIKYVPAD
jgi:anti-sigma regulatory factor (Ser/Thr protein kinase)